MDALFSCRNRVHNGVQTLNLGAGTGYCLKAASGLTKPDQTTSKYLHRKDLPRFAVDEGLALALIQELDTTPQFTAEMLNGDDSPEAREEALWDVFFVRLSGLQEFGGHAGLDELRWFSDSLNGALSSFDWAGLRPELTKARPHLTKAVLALAKKEKVYFGQTNEAGAMDVEGRA